MFQSEQDRHGWVRSMQARCVCDRNLPFGDSGRVMSDSLTRCRSSRARCSASPSRVSPTADTHLSVTAFSAIPGILRTASTWCSGMRHLQAVRRRIRRPTSSKSEINISSISHGDLDHEHPPRFRLVKFPLARLAMTLRFERQGVSPLLGCGYVLPSLPVCFGILGMGRHGRPGADVFLHVSGIRFPRICCFRTLEQFAEETHRRLRYCT